MAICEDAPCCGCCGPAVWAADALAEQERAWDRLNDPYAWGDDAADEDEADEAEMGEDAWLDSYMEDRLSSMYG